MIQSRLLCVLLIVQLTAACSSEYRDRQIKADITSKAKNDINFSGAHFTVDKRKVTLWGSCPTEKSRRMVVQALSTIHVIKSIDDHLVIGPIVIGADLTGKEEVDSVLADYPKVSAEVSQTAVKLFGKVSQKDLGKLLKSVREVNTSAIDMEWLATGN